MKLPTISESKKQFLLIVLIVTLCSIITDLYTPSFSEMVKKLDTTMNGVQWSLSVFVLMVALSHLVYGSLSEFFGRKKMLLIGLSLAVLGSVLCVMAISLEDLLVGRSLQGLGVGASAVLWRSIFRDKYEGEELARQASFMAPIAISAIILAPFLGGIIQSYFAWRANFIYLLCHISVVLLFIFFKFKETKKSNKFGKKEGSRFKHILGSYKELLTSRVFMSYSFCCFLSFGAFFVWTVSAPVILMEGMNMSPYEFGKVMLITALPLGLGGYINGKIVSKFSITQILRVAWGWMFLAPLFILVVPFFVTPLVWMLVAPIFIFTFVSGFVWPNLFAAAFEPFGHISGVAASLYGLIQLLGGAFFSGLLSIIKEPTQIPMGAVMLFCVASSILIHETLIKKN